MRYLTHETEDHFWTSHGAKSHPLAEAEEVKRAQIKLEQEQQQALRAASSTAKTVNFAEPDRLSNSSSGLLSNGSPGMLESPEVFSNLLNVAASLKENREGEEEGEEDEESDESEEERKRKYLLRNDNDILKAQQHAARVGYKVSTV